MSMNGNLADVTVADVIQFIYLGRSTGTLVLTRDDETARVGFHEGDIINARSADTPRLGEMLLEEGAVTQQDIDRVIEIQRHQRHPQPLGDLLVDTGLVSEEAVTRAVVEQARRTIIGVLRWSEGRFDFTREIPEGWDGLSNASSDARLLKVKLNTERLLLEAAQSVDTATDAAPSEGEGDGHSAGGALVARLLAGSEPSREPDSGVERTDWENFRSSVMIGAEEQLLGKLGVEVLSRDERFVDAVNTRVESEPDLMAKLTLGSGEGGWVLVDLREGHHGLSTLETAAERATDGQAIAIIDNVNLAATAYEHGAGAAVAADPEAVTSCLRALASRSDERLERERRAAVSAALIRLRRVMEDIRSGTLSTTVALTLMDFVGELVERAVIFLVLSRELRALGGFGYGANRQPLTELTSELHLDRRDRNAITATVYDGQVRELNWADESLPPGLKKLLGPPRHDQVIVLPVQGSERVMAVIYADNGEIRRPIRDIEVLEIAGLQVGTALENELLRRQLSTARGKFEHAAAAGSKG